MGEDNVFDPSPIGHNHMMDTRMWRVFVKDSVDPEKPMRHEPTLLYAICHTTTGFGIRDFIDHLRLFGYGCFTPVARDGQFGKDGRRIGPEKFGDVFARNWSWDMKDIMRYSNNTHVFAMHGWSFAQLIFCMHKMGMITSNESLEMLRNKFPGGPHVAQGGASRGVSGRSVTPALPAKVATCPPPSSASSTAAPVKSSMPAVSSPAAPREASTPGALTVSSTAATCTPAQDGGREGQRQGRVTASALASALESLNDGTPAQAAREIQQQHDVVEPAAPAREATAPAARYTPGQGDKVEGLQQNVIRRLFPEGQEREGTLASKGGHAMSESESENEDEERKEELENERKVNEALEEEVRMVLGNGEEEDMEDKEDQSNKEEVMDYKKKKRICRRPWVE